MAEHVRDLLSAYLDQELSHEEQRQVERHLNHCLACQEEMEVLASLKEQTALAYAAVEIPEGIEEAVMAKIAEHQRAFYVASAARKWGSVVLAALLAVLLYNQIAPAVSFILAMGYRFLQVISFLVTSTPYLLGIVFAVAIMLIIFSVWSLRRLLGAETFS